MGRGMPELGKRQTGDVDADDEDQRAGELQRAAERGEPQCDASTGRPPPGTSLVREMATEQRERKECRERSDELELDPGEVERCEHPCDRGQQRPAESA